VVSRGARSAGNKPRLAAFQQKAQPGHSAEQNRISYLEKKVQTKDEVLAELMAEHVALIRTLGEL
jgi:hypothetical protein